jgi:hypothetical protein
MKQFLNQIPQKTARVIITAAAIFAAGGAMSAFAASTISTNIQTDGNLSVTGTSAQTGLATFGSSVLVQPAYGVDTSAAGVLGIGTTTATSISIGRSGVTTTLGGALTVAAGGAAITGVSSVNGNFTLGPATSHIISTQTTIPTTSAVTYTLGTVLAGSTDTKGQFTVTTTAATGSATLVFQTAYATAPICVVSPASANAQVDASKTYVTSSTSGLTINYNATPTANLQTWNYVCAQ